MNTYKFYTQKGDQYHRIPQMKMYAVIGLLFLAIGFVLWYRTQTMFSLLYLIFLSIVALFYFARMFSTMIIDLGNQTITYKPTLYSATKVYSLNNITDLSMSSKIYVLVLNVRAFIWVDNKALRIGQSLMTPKPMEELLIETEKILGFNNRSENG
ncbi:hypothetical protein CEY12_01545 [Chryseobacterium sp. T16E-39]|uniref:hypothetical protein n=1 Tax=Chryseobacterium sp. T16E-39 TaxID=2015076 RepID=UPI000B5B43E1|nr:hypothetical protein [Chryseobacterium sp. T16E-39]ASK28870.1 hypothetical protein CEY12_01545 [Chryseobacterium sp. T16E-39]